MLGWRRDEDRELHRVIVDNHEARLQSVEKRL